MTYQSAVNFKENPGSTGAMNYAYRPTHKDTGNMHQSWQFRLREDNLEYGEAIFTDLALPSYGTAGPFFAHDLRVVNVLWEDGRAKTIRDPYKDGKVILDHAKIRAAYGP